MNAQTPEERAVLDRNLKQIELAQTPENLWFAGQKLNHQPNLIEAVMHFIKFGGSENFAENESAKKS